MSVKNFSGFVTLSQRQTLLPKRLGNGQSTIQEYAFLSNFNVVAIQNSLDGFCNTLYVRNNSKTSRWFPFIKSVTICNWFLAVTEKSFCIAICH